MEWVACASPLAGETTRDPLLIYAPEAGMLSLLGADRESQ
jgi:hypothetical protein